MKQNETILLIGNEIDGFESLAATFRQIGYKVLSAVDGREGFRLVRRESPDLVICGTRLAVISAPEFCRMIRADRELRATPLMFLSESDPKGENLSEILDAGADQCLVEFSNTQHLAVIAAWLIKRKYEENQLIQNYEILRRRQRLIAQIVKGTSDLFTASQLERKAAASLNEISDPERLKQISRSMDRGTDMINLLANLLEERISALEIRRQPQCADEFVFDRNLEIKITDLSGECVSYVLEENDLPAH